MSKKLIVSIFVIAAVVLASAFATIAFLQNNEESSRASGAQTNSRTLVFGDEFEGSEVDESKWNFCYDGYSEQYQGCVNYGNWENQWYKRSQVSQKAGSLVLTAERKEAVGDNRYGAEQTYAYTSGMVSSGARDTNSAVKWEGSYGYYEAKILVPKGQAVWPAFWLLPTDRSWPPEIDIMEVLGQKPDQYLTTYHWPTAEGTPAQQSQTHDVGENLSDGWHVFAVDWREGKIDWYLDDKLMYSVEGENVPSKNMQIILNLAVGGMLPGEIDDTTPDKLLMLVDYVRVYDKK